MFTVRWKVMQFTEKGRNTGGRGLGQGGMGFRKQANRSLGQMELEVF